MDGMAWKLWPGASDADRTKLRTKRKEIWLWFIEVTIFRVLSTFNIVLHGVHLPSPCDKQKMSPTSQGQALAAHLFAEQFAASNISDGKGSSGFGIYIRNVSTNTGSKSTCVQHATTVCASSTSIECGHLRHHGVLCQPCLC